MAYVRQARMDRNKRILIIVSLSALSLLILTMSIMMFKKDTPTEPNLNLSVGAEQSKYINIVRTNQKIKAGEQADAAKFEVVAVPKNLVPDSAVFSMQSLKDKRVASDLERNEFLTECDLVDSSSWYENGDRLMEHTFQNGVIPATVSIGSVVDIKLFKQGSEDVVVVSKVAVVGKAENTLSFYLNPAEQEYLKEANTEGQLFIVQYLDESQEASGITYHPTYARGKELDKNIESFASSSAFKE